MDDGFPKALSSLRAPISGRDTGSGALLMNRLLLTKPEGRVRRSSGACGSRPHPGGAEGRVHVHPKRGRGHLRRPGGAIGRLPDVWLFLASDPQSVLPQDRRPALARAPVVFRVRARRFFCDEASCQRRIFCERLPEVAAHARKTDRLEGRSCSWPSSSGAGPALAWPPSSGCSSPGTPCSEDCATHRRRPSVR
jgi:hypothetical protein